MANVTAWARQCAAAHQYLADAVGHGLDTGLARQCLTLAQSALDSAEKMASRTADPIVGSPEMDHVDLLRKLLELHKIGAKINERG